MKILYITTRVSGSGGVAKVLSLKASCLVEKFNHDVHIISSNDFDNTTFFSFSENIKLHFIKKSKVIFRQLFFVYEIRKLVNKIQPDVVIIADNGFKSFVIPFIISKTKIIYELHASTNHFLNSTTYKNIPFYKFILKKALKKCDYVIKLNKSQNFDFLPKNRQIVIPNPIKFYEGKIKFVNSKRVIAVGRMTSLKGYERMLHSWKEVCKKYPDYILDIFGASDKDFDIEKLIKDLKMDNSVKVHETVNNLEEFYLNSEFLLHASYDECFPMVFLEAMNFGLPIVCFNLKSDLIDSEYCLVANNQNQFIDNIIQLIQDENLRIKLSNNAKSKSNNYKIEQIVKEWNTILIDTTNIS